MFACRVKNCTRNSYIAWIMFRLGVSSLHTWQYAVSNKSPQEARIQDSRGSLIPGFNCLEFTTTEYIHLSSSLLSFKAQFKTHLILITFKSYLYLSVCTLETEERWSWGSECVCVCVYVCVCVCVCVYVCVLSKTRLFYRLFLICFLAPEDIKHCIHVWVFVGFVLLILLNFVGFVLLMLFNVWVFLQVYI